MEIQNIASILKMPVGTEVAGFNVIVKTTKKKWQFNNSWFHQVVLMDKTGEILADVNIIRNIPLIRGQEIKVIKAETQDTEKGMKLYVDWFGPLLATEPPGVMDFATGESDRVIKSKIKCWLVAACLQSGTSPDKVDKDTIDSLVEYVIK